MACKTGTDIVPRLLDGLPNIREVTSKLPQVQIGKAKDWKSLRVLRVVLWLANPANMALVKSLLNIKNLGDLTKLTALTNLMRYAGMDGFVDVEKVSDKLSTVTDALDCIAKNVEALQNIQNSIIQQVQEALSFSQIYSALGVSQVLSDLGIVDNYLFSRINSEVAKNLGLPKLSSLPGVSGVIPLPSAYTQFQQAVYTANSLTQTYYVLGLVAQNKSAADVFSAASKVSSMIPTSTAGTDGALVLASGASVVRSVASGTNVLDALNSLNYTGITDTQYPGGPLELPGTPVSVPTGNGTDTAPISKTAESTLSEMGSLNLGVLQDGITKQSILYEDKEESILWRKRVLNLQLAKYEREFREIDEELNQLSSILSKVPKTKDEETELTRLLEDLQKDHARQFESWRVLDYKVKSIRYELRELEAEHMDTTDTKGRLDTWVNSLTMFGASPVHPYTSTDSRTASRVTDRSACGWEYLEDVQVAPGTTVHLLFHPGANNPVHPQFKQWFELLVQQVSKVLPIRTLTISSTTEGVHARTSWHYKGGAVDIAAINGTSITSLGDSYPVKTLQSTAISLGSRECKGPSYGTDAYHKNHIHISRVVPTSTLCDKSSKTIASPQNIQIDKDA